MGGSIFIDFHETEKELTEAFDEAVEQAQYDHGHAGYSGTLAEKSKVVDMSQAETQELAEEKAEEFLDRDDYRIRDKWGPAGAIRVLNPKGWVFFGIASS